MMKKLTKFLGILTVISLIVGIVYRVLILPKIFDRGQKRQNINYPSLLYEPEVSTKLQQLGIPHKIDEEGTLLYSSLYKDTVERVYAEVDKHYFPDWGNQFFGIEKYRNQFTSLLKENNIPYIIRKLDAEGNDYILWDPMYDVVAKALRDKVREEMQKNYHKN